MDPSLNTQRPYPTGAVPVHPLDLDLSLDQLHNSNQMGGLANRLSPNCSFKTTILAPPNASLINLEIAASSHYRCQKSWEQSYSKVNPQPSNASAAVQPNVSILALLSSEPLLSQLQAALDSQQYTLNHVSTAEAFIQLLGQEPSIDCLLLDEAAAQPSLFETLRKVNVLLPIVILASDETSPEAAHELYHHAEVSLPTTDLGSVGDRINAAIKQFLQLSPKETSFQPGETAELTDTPPSPELLLEQQQRLASKLKERLGYLGVYYKRNASNFYHNLAPEEQQQLIEELTTKYQGILLAYFSETTGLNILIDEFINLSFFTDISVTQIVEIHMKLIDDYSKQLKLEGRNEAVLINYRLTLLDIISHLCEMYRRSIPRESKA